MTSSPVMIIPADRASSGQLLCLLAQGVRIRVLNQPRHALSHRLICFPDVCRGGGGGGGGGLCTVQPVEYAQYWLKWEHVGVL